MRRLGLVIVLVVSCSWNVLPAFADEPARDFLEALRDNGYHEVAIEYLTSIKGSTAVEPDFRSSIPFELAQTMIGSTRTMRDIEKVEARLDQAQVLLSEYASGDQSVEVSAHTLHYQGNLLERRSTIYLSQSESDRLTADEKNELYEKTRATLKSSLDSFTKAKAEIRKLIDPNSPDAIKIDPEDPSTSDKRDQFKAAYTTVRSKIPQISEALAETYDEASGERQKYLQSAQAEYKKVWESYPKYLAGIESCVFAARCSQKLGKPKEALDLLIDIFALGDNAILKPIKRQAFVIASDCWQATDPYPYNEAVIRLGPAVEVLNKVEIAEPDWLRIQMEYAVALRAKAAEVKSKGGPTSNRESKDMERAAGRTVRNVARVESQYRERARTLMTEWNVSMKEASEGVAAVGPPASFEEAREQSKDLVGEIEVAVTEYSALKKQIAVEKDPAKKAELQSQLGEFKAQLDGLSKKGLASLDVALGLATKDTVRADIIGARYWQCYCFFANGRYIEAALIGQFLLDKYPNVDGTKQTMSLLIQSHSLMMDQADKPEDKAYEREQLKAVCDAVIARWPGSNEAAAGASAMTRVSLNAKDFELAETYYNSIPESAEALRSQIGVRLGQQIWKQYEAMSKAPDAKAEELQPMLTKAKKMLSNGVETYTKDTLTFDVALGALYLVDVHVAAGEIDKAVERLESDTIAPLDLVLQQHPAITNTPLAAIFRRETYKTAIKTYLAAMGSSDDQQKWIGKTSQIMAAMREEMDASQDPKDKARIMAIYQTIAKELKENFDRLEDPSKKTKFANSLAKFLGSIESDSNDSRTVLWAGSTLLTVAESLSQGGNQTAAKPLFDQASKALSKAESLGFKGGGTETVAMLNELKRQRALAQRGGGNFQGAIDQFAEILAESPNSLAVQIDSAETLQMWGASSKDAKRYIEAVKGARSVTDPKTKRKKKQIWGWEKIAIATRSNVKLRNTFYEALYHVAECRLEFGVISDNAGAIKAAGNEISKERKRDPTFNGSAEWKAKFDALEKRVKSQTTTKR